MPKSYSSSPHHKKSKKHRKSRSRSKKKHDKHRHHKSRRSKSRSNRRRSKSRSNSSNQKPFNTNKRSPINSREREKQKRKQQERLVRARALRFEKFTSSEESEKEEGDILPGLQTKEQKEKKKKEAKEKEDEENLKAIKAVDGLIDSDGLEEFGGEEGENERYRFEEDDEDFLAIEEERIMEAEAQQIMKIEAEIQQEQQNEEQFEGEDCLDDFMNGINDQAVPQIDDRPPDKIDPSKIITIDDIVKPKKKKKKKEKKVVKNSDDDMEDEDEDDESDSEDSNDSDEEVLNPNKNYETSSESEKSLDSAEEEEYYRKFKEEMLKKDEVKKKADFVSDASESGEPFDHERFKKQEEEAGDFLAKMKKKHETKELEQVDHAAIDYIKIRKNFYIEPKEIAQMTEQEVEDFRRKLGDIQVRGKDVARPIRSWYEIGLSDIQLRILTEIKKYPTPFAIQQQCLPVIMSGRDTIGIAETGSGKTMAFVLPMLRHVQDQPRLQEGDGPIGLVFAPTRELADQIWREIRSFTKHMGINAVCVYGGACIKGQLSELRRGAEIVICTPGRLIDILTISTGRIMNLKRVSFVVLDEADRMLDQGFEPQIMKILQNCRPDRQTVMFSATFPRNVEMLARNILFRPIEVIVGSRGQACKNIEQTIEVRDESSKLRRLLEILGDWQEKGSVLIFVDKQTEADDLFKELLKYGYPSLLLHGAIDATDREFTIRDFKKQVLNIMVATSVCARGLDIQHISLVVNFQCPNHMEDYIHRIGRTGRAGKKGYAITFITPEEESYSLDLQKALLMSGQPIPPALADLVRKFKKKVEQGEARIHVNKNLTGSGYRFDENESSKLEAAKTAIKKRFQMENNIDQDDSDSGEIIVRTQKRSENQKERSVNQKLAMIKDPQKRQAIMQEGFKAAQQALLQGLPQETVMNEAAEAIKNALNLYNPIRSADQNVIDAANLMDEFEKKEMENSDVVIYDFEINDYPQNARSKVMHRDLLAQMYDNYGCTVNIRGQHIELGKKAPPGIKPLYLRIQGDTKYSVTTCFKELKKVAEEFALRNLSITNGPVGKFNV